MTMTITITMTMTITITCASASLCNLPFSSINFRSRAANASCSHVTRHTSHVTRHTSHVTRHTSHVTRHTSHVTRHTSHVTRVADLPLPLPRCPRGDRPLPQRPSFLGSGPISLLRVCVCSVSHLIMPFVHSAFFCFLVLPNLPGHRDIHSPIRRRSQRTKAHGSILSPGNHPPDVPFALGLFILRKRASSLLYHLLRSRSQSL
jgi:hypothetical protein